MDEQLQQIFVRAKEQLDNKKYRAALGDFTFVLEREKAWPEALFYRGWARYYNLDKLGAADDIVRALALKPELATQFADTGIPVRELTKQLNSKACRSIGAGRSQDALGEVAGALRIEPDYPMAMLTMAEAYVALEEPTAAIDWLEKAVTAAAEYAGEIDTYDCYAPLRGYPRYQKLIGEEKKLSSEDKALLAQANEQFAQKQYQEVLASCEQVLALVPNWPEALLYRGLVKYRLTANTGGWVTELLLKSGGLDDLARAMEYEPSLEEVLIEKGPLSRELLASALNERGCDYIAAKQYKEAFRDIKQALRLQPEYVMAHLTMAEYYVAWSKHEEALDWLEKAAALDNKIIPEIDTYDCFQPLRVYERYGQFTGGAPATDKSFYVLEMFVEPGTMREFIRFASDSLQHIEQVLTAGIKGEWGFYKLLRYGQHIRLHRFEQGKRAISISLLPFILVTVPGHLTASFAETGRPDILDMEGRPLPVSIEKTVIKKHKRTGAAYEMKESISRDKYLSDLLWEYRAFSQTEETLFLTPFAEAIGALEGVPLAAGEEAETAEGVFVADEGREEESGNTFSMEEYLNMMREEPA